MLHACSTWITQRLPAFRYRNYRLFWCGQLISLIGTWMQSVGQAWLVLTLTNSALDLGIVSALQFTPVLLLALWGGAIADRVPKRNLLVVTQSSALVLALIMGILTSTHLIQVWQIMILATLLGLVNAVDTPTRQAFVGEMVAKEAIGSAVALNSSLFNAARLIGPAVGGSLIGLLGIAPLFWFNAASFIAVIVALVQMRIAPRPVQTRRGSMGAQILEGLGHVRRTPLVALVLLLVGVIGTFGINFQVLVPLFAQSVLHKGAAGYGLLLASLGAGALIAAVSLAFGGRAPRLGRVVSAALLFSLLELAFAASRAYPLSLALLALDGFAMVMFTATANTIVQTNTPEELRGRVMSIYVILFAGTTPIGSLFIGVLAHAYGAPVAMASGGGLSALAALYGVLAWWRLRSPGSRQAGPTTLTRLPPHSAVTG
jgi:MFS family permease